MNEGFTLEDFKQVHRNKSSWLNDKKMSSYYRPATLYGTKFESYLQEEATTKEFLDEYL